MTIVLNQEAEPATPSSVKCHVYLGTDGRVYVKKPDGSREELAGGRVDRNALTNGTFLFAQRVTPGSLTTISNTSGRTYAADRWGITNENASAQYRRVDSIASPESGLGARFHAELKKITSAGKVIMSQVMEGVDTAPYRGRRVRVQFKARNVTGSHTLRLALLQLTSSGAVDTIPATFVSAFGANTVDPTWGTNLAAITPALGSTYSTVSGAGVSSALTSGWRQYGGVFLVPTTALNLVVALFTDAQMAADDIVRISEVALFDGDEERSVLCTDVHDELERCQRFYHKTFELDVAPVQNVGAVTGAARFPAMQPNAFTQRSHAFQHPVRMRGTPTAVTFNPLAANTQIRDSSAGDCSATAVQSLTDRTYAFQCTGHASTAVANALAVHVTFDAEL
jgi:hypothetical protein